MTTRPSGATPTAAPVDLDRRMPDLGLRDLQATIRATYGQRDRERGVDAALGWFIEEVGELSRAIRRQGPDEREEEFADVLAWLVSLADLSGVDIAAAAARYATECPACQAAPCDCGQAA